MKKHPLTDEIIEEKLITRDECLRREGDGRAMYYEEDFRVGADWQLEQVMKWLDENLSNYTDDDYLGDCEPLHKLEGDLKRAMCPTKTQEDN